MQDTRRLIIMRHATALSQGPGGRDYDRQLSPQGEREARAMAQWLAHTQPPPEVVVSSPAARTRATSEAVAAAWGDRAPPLEWDAALYLADGELLLERLLDDARAQLLVGHNPGLEDAVRFLLGDEPAAGVQMVPAALCILELPRKQTSARTGMARLIAHLRPELLPQSELDGRPSP